MSPNQAAGRPARGFTLIELSIASVLTALLGVLLLTAWSAYGRAAAEVLARCRMAEEADLALTSLADDMGATTSDTLLGIVTTGSGQGFEEQRLEIHTQDAQHTEPTRYVVYAIDQDLIELAHSGRRLRRRKLVRRVETRDPYAIVESPRVVAWDVSWLGVRVVEPGCYEFQLTLALPIRRGQSNAHWVERTYPLVVLVP